MMSAFEIDFDGIVGPTHNYAALSRGNIASMKNAFSASSPRQAALQGLEKMRLVASLGVRQAVLPPHERPHIPTLRRLGFEGSDARIIEDAARREPGLLLACTSASAMWTANAATISPSADTGDGRVHITPANLVSMFHRSIEPATTAAVLQAVFRDPECFAHHPPLPPCPQFGDEGAANHMRLCADHGAPGVEVFVFGHRALATDRPAPRRFPARQSFEASSALARLHGLSPERTLLTQQNPAAIDGGAFHNDVVAVANENVLLCHETAFLERETVFETLRRLMEPSPLHVVELKDDELPLGDAVSSYLFNSQLVTLPGEGSDRRMALVAPAECEENVAVRRCIERIIAEPGPIAEVHFAQVRQSMRNGGGPACLRLRAALTSHEAERVHQGVLLDQRLADRLETWINRHYRDRLESDDLADPALLEEGRRALDELTSILGLGAVYGFQTG